MGSPFSDNYTIARARFRDAAASLGWRLESHPIGEPGADLSIDVAIGDGAENDRAVVLSSGTHGVEGFFGSAVQLALLEQWRSAHVRPRQRIVFVHAVNPFGFAHLRRVDAANIDLNRNFLIPGQPYLGAPPEYVRLNPLLNPLGSRAGAEFFRARMAAAALRFGRRAVTRAIAIGQYDFPRGLFFGGQAPAGSHRVLATHLRQWTAGCREVVHLDLHTGLGPRGECRVLVDYPLSVNQRRTGQQLFGREADTIDSGRLYYTARGALSQWSVANTAVENCLFAYVEVGTYGALDVLEALRAENRLHHWGDVNGDAMGAAKARLKEVFCPEDETWRRRTLAAATARVMRTFATG